VLQALDEPLQFLALDMSPLLVRVDEPYRLQEGKGVILLPPDAVLRAYMCL